MFSFRKKAAMPTASEALPGRAQPIPTARRHFVNGRDLAPPYPEGTEQVLFGMGCFWGAEKAFWNVQGVWVTAVGYAGGTTPNPTYEEVCSVSPAKTRSCWSSMIPGSSPSRSCLQVFWEGHDPTQGMRQGNDAGTQYRSAIYAATQEQIAAAEASRKAYEKRARGGRLRRHHDGNRDGRPLLFRRGLSPAISGQEPPWLLRTWRHRRLLPDRNRRHDLTGHGSGVGFQAGKTAPEMPSKAPGTSSSHKSLSGSTGPGSSSRPFGTLEKPERR